MPSQHTRVNAVIHAFNRGEVSTAALARIDQEPLRLAAQVQENLLPSVIGKAVARPGTKWLGQVPEDVRARLLPFVFAVSDTALLELTSHILRVWVNDTLVTRPSVTSEVTNGTFSATDGWLTTKTGGATISFAGADATLNCPSLGGQAILTRPVTTTSPGTLHALRIIISRGPVIFRCGTVAGDDRYIAETALDTGEHSLAFTPTGGEFSPYFVSRLQRQVIIDSIAVESAGVMTLPTPYATDGLRNIRFDQSGDILFLAHSSHQQRKIERRGIYSWSFVKYQSATPPFSVFPTRTGISLTPGHATSGSDIYDHLRLGNTQINASRRMFDATDDVDNMFKVHHSGQIVRQNIAADNTFTNPIEVGSSEWASTFDNFVRTRSGVWDGTWRLQTSVDGPEFGFVTTSSATTGLNASNTIDSAINAISWVRAGFGFGDYHNSGTLEQTLRTEYSGGYGIIRITSAVATAGDGEVLRYFVGRDPSFDWEECEWNHRVGWPSGVCLFDGRLWWAGRDKLWGSVSDDYYSFDVDVEGDSGPILINIATGAINQARWLLPLQRLIIGTEGAEVSARASSFDEPLTPTGITLKDASTQGVAAVSPVKIDSTGIYVQRAGKRVYALNIGEGGDYKSVDLTRLNPEIGGTGTGGIVEISVQRQPDTRLWCVRSDGQVALLLYEPDEQVVAWSRFITASSLASDGFVESVCVLPGAEEDAVYMVIKRSLSTATGSDVVRYVEKLAMESQALGAAGNHFMLDSYVSATEGVSTFSHAHLDHFRGETVAAWGRQSGIYRPIGSFTVATEGSIALGGTYDNVVVGLPYNWRYQSAKLAYGAQAGTALLQPKKVHSVGLVLENFLIDSVDYGRDFTHLSPLPRVKDGVPVTLTTLQTVHDERAFPFEGTWDTDSRVCLRGTAPYPCTLNAMVVGVELNEFD